MKIFLISLIIALSFGCANTKLFSAGDEKYGEVEISAGGLGIDLTGSVNGLGVICSVFEQKWMAWASVATSTLCPDRDSNE